MPTLIGMWNVNERFEAPLILEKLALAGFQVGSTGGVVRVEKYGCASEFRRTPDNHYQMTILPSILHGSQFTRLWDAGYQKFFITDDERKVPALARALQQMRKFNEELRSALGVSAYYNEALGSTCQVTTYDRVQGEPGDVPDSTVGIQSGNKDH